MSLDAGSGGSAGQWSQRACAWHPATALLRERGWAAAHFPSFLISGYIFNKETVRIKCIYSRLENPMEPGGLQSMASQRHDLGTNGQPQCLK